MPQKVPQQGLQRGTQHGMQQGLQHGMHRGMQRGQGMQQGTQQDKTLTLLSMSVSSLSSTRTDRRNDLRMSLCGPSAPERINPMADREHQFCAAFGCARTQLTVELERAQLERDDLRAKVREYFRTRGLYEASPSDRAEAEIALRDAVNDQS